jgi:hypothetical protein
MTASWSIASIYVHVFVNFCVVNVSSEGGIVEQAEVSSVVIRK